MILPALLQCGAFGLPVTASVFIKHLTSQQCFRIKRLTSRHCFSLSLKALSAIGTLISSFVGTASVFIKRLTSPSLLQYKAFDDLSALLRYGAFDLSALLQYRAFDLHVTASV